MKINRFGEVKYMRKGTQVFLLMGIAILMIWTAYYYHQVYGEISKEFFTAYLFTGIVLFFGFLCYNLSRLTE